MEKLRLSKQAGFAQCQGVSALAELEAELWLFCSPVLQELNHTLLSYTNKNPKRLNVSTEAKLIASRSELA